MKRLLLLLSCIVMPATSYCQITISKTAHKAEEKTIVPYDSTKNYLGVLNVESYIGQLLYVKEKPEAWRTLGYDHFFTKKDGVMYHGEDIYKKDGDSYHSRYEDLAGKYFYVLEVCRSQENIYKYVFHLQNRDNANDKCWYEYDPDHEWNFPFITISHFNWLKNKIGTKIIIDYWINDSKEVRMPIGEFDFHTGAKITFNPSDAWEIQDVTILDEDFDLVYIISNGKGATSTIKIEVSNSRSITQKEYLNLCAKHGKQMVETARQGKIKVGMHSELVIYAWGEPTHINRSSYGPDQWCYDGDYVYIERGFVEAWN